MRKSRERVNLGDFVKRGCTYYEVVKIEIFRSERQEEWEKTYRLTLKDGKRNINLDLCYNSDSVEILEK